MNIIIHMPYLKVPYHDPCHLVRGQGISKQPRKILNNINGVDNVELIAIE